MRVRARVLTALAMAAALGLAGCGDTASTGSSTGSEGEESVEAVEGRWASDQTGEPHLVFAADGSVQGSDGCNEISTTYVQDGALVTLKNFASTLRACPGVDTWLRHGRVLEIDGSAMTVKNAEDEEIGTLTRDDAGTASPAPTET